MEDKLKAIDEYLNNFESLEFEEGFEKKDTLKEHVLYLIKYLDGNKYSYSCKTYEKKSKKLITGVARNRRSIQELFLLVRDDFDITIVDLYKVLFELLKEKEISSFICRDIRKRVYFLEHYGNRGFTSEDIDEFNMSYSELMNETLPQSDLKYGESHGRGQLNFLI